MLDKTKAPAAEADPNAPDPSTEKPAAPATGAPDKGAEAPAPAAPRTSEPPAEGDEGAPADKGTEDFRAKFEDTEAKRRDAQSKADRLENDLRGAREQLNTGLQTLDRQWRSYIERNAPELYTAMTKAEADKNGAAQNERSAQDASARVILGIYREGDKDFGDYLSAIAEDGARVTTQSLARHRETFQRIRGTREADKGNGAAAADAKPVVPASPPRIPGAGRAPAEAPPAWKEGQPFNPRKLLSEGLKNKDASRRR